MDNMFIYSEELKATYISSSCHCTFFLLSQWLTLYFQLSFFICLFCCVCFYPSGWSWRTSVTISRTCASAVRTPTFLMVTSAASGNAWFTTAAGWLGNLRVETSMKVSRYNYFTFNCKHKMSVVSFSFFMHTSTKKHQTVSEVSLSISLITCRNLCNKSSVPHPGDCHRWEGAGRCEHLAFSDAEASAGESQRDKNLPNGTYPL